MTGILQSSALFVHVAGGVAAILAGFTALFVRKGGRVHRRVGNAFAATMTIAALGAAWLGYLANDLNDITGGILTAYLVATAWVAARRHDGESGIFELVAFAIAGFGATVTVLAVLETGRSGATGVGNGPALAFAAVIGLAALLDLNVVLRKGLYGKHRIARHLWRMCAAMFVATGSFFFGQMQVIPEALRRVDILSVPVFLPVVLMIYWMARNYGRRRPG